jgi:hypothetical protein
MEQLWIGAIHGDPEREREIPFQGRGVVWDEMGSTPVRNQRADMFDQAGTLEQFRGEWPW